MQAIGHWHLELLCLSENLCELSLWNCSAFSPFDVWFFGLHGFLDLAMRSSTVSNQGIAALHCTPGSSYAAPV